MRVLGLSREGRQWRRACSTRGGRGRRGIGRPGRVRALRLDSLDEDEEGDEAELLPCFDFLGEAPGDGDAAAGAARSRLKEQAMPGCRLEGGVNRRLTLFLIRGLRFAE